MLNDLTENFLDLLAHNATFLVITSAVVLFGYLFSSFLLARIFRKASAPSIAAFVPVWNVVKFLQLGGYSSLWFVGFLLSALYAIGLLLFAPIGRIFSVDFLVDAADVFYDIALVAIPIASFLMVACGLVFLIAAYNITRAFNRDVGYLLLFVFAPIVWLILLAFTSYDWDESEAHPNSVGEMYSPKRQRDAARELELQRQKGMSVLNPVYQSPRPEDEFESDYDRAVASYERQKSLEKIPGKKPKRKQRSSATEGMIVDPGDHEKIDPNWT